MQSPAKKLIELFESDLSYCEPALKEDFHHEGKKVFRKLAQCMGLRPTQYNIRSNKGGIAVSGEVILHAENVYVHLTQSFLGSDSALMMRSCSNLKDFVGGQNHFAPIEVLNDLGRLAIYLEGIANNQVSGTNWNLDQVRFEITHIRANKIMTPELERVRKRFENDEISIEVFEHAIENAERIRSAA